MNISPVGNYNYNYRANFSAKQRTESSMEDKKANGSSYRQIPANLALLGMLMSGMLPGCAVVNKEEATIIPHEQIQKLSLEDQKRFGDLIEKIAPDKSKSVLDELQSKSHLNPMARLVPNVNRDIYKSKDDTSYYSLALAQIQMADRIELIEKSWKKYPEYMPLRAEVQVQYEKDVANLKDALLENYLRQGGKIEWLKIPEDASDADLARVLLLNLKVKTHAQNKFVKELAKEMVRAINDKEECPEQKMLPGGRYLLGLSNGTIDPKFAVRTALSLMERDLETGAQFCKPSAFDLIQQDINLHSGGGGGNSGGSTGGGSTGGGSTGGGGTGGGTGGGGSSGGGGTGGSTGGGGTGGGGGSTGGGGGGSEGPGAPGGSPGSSSPGGPGSGGASGNK